MDEKTEKIVQILRAFPGEVLAFFKEAKVKGMCEPVPGTPHLLTIEEAALLTWSLSYHLTVRHLGGVALDDMETSNHHLYISAGPLRGSVFFLCHDGDSRVVYDSLATFMAAIIQARNDGVDVEDWHQAQSEPLSPIAADQASLSAWIRQLLCDDDAGVLIPQFMPSLDLTDASLLRDLAMSDDFYIAESVGRAISARPNQALGDIARLCSQHKHPQASLAGVRALGRIKALSR